MTSLHPSNMIYPLQGPAHTPTNSTHPLLPMAHPQLAHPSNPQMTAPLMSTPSKLISLNEQTWLKIGSLSEAMSESERAIYAYESAIRHNPYSILALQRLGHFYLQQERYNQASECFQRLINLDNHHGDAWASLALCYTWMDEYQKSYGAYQQALCCLQNPRDASVWHGIGLLYDRFGSYEQAEEAYLNALSMDPTQELLHVIYYRLGMLYTKKKKYEVALECFRFVLSKPPKSISYVDILYQVAILHEFKSDYSTAKETFEYILTETPNHVKSLQRLGWLYFQSNTLFKNESQASILLLRASELESSNSISHYLLGRLYYHQKQYTKAYESYQQAVYRDGKQPAFWCSIGILYYTIGQARDALDAYIRAIHLSATIWEIWWNLGILYESCNNQSADALDAYQHALEVDPSNTTIKDRITLLKSSDGSNTSTLPSVIDLSPWTITITPNLGTSNAPLTVDTQSIHQKPRVSSIPSAPAYSSLPSRFNMPNFASLANSTHPSQYYTSPINGHGSQGTIPANLIPIMNARNSFNTTPQRRSITSPESPQNGSVSRNNSIGNVSRPSSPQGSISQKTDSQDTESKVNESDLNITNSIGMEQLANQAIDRQVTDQ